MSNEIHIIGRGIIGLSAGFRLLQSGWKVTFVGPSQNKFTASFAATGVSSQRSLIEPRAPLFQAKQLGHRNLEAWIKEVEIISKTPIFHDFSGIHEVFSSLEDYQANVERMYKRSFQGCFPIEKKMRQDGIVFRYMNDGFFDHLALMEGLEKACKALGATYFDDETTCIKKEKSTFYIETLSKKILAKNILVAAGFGSQKILEASSYLAPMLAGVSGSSFEISTKSLENICHIKKTFSCTSLNGKIILGSSSKKDMDDEVDEKMTFQNLADYFPASRLRFESSKIKHRWGVRAKFQDRLPRMGILDEISSTSKLWISCGFYKNGIQLADVFAKEFSKLVNGQNLECIFENFLL